MTEFLMTATQRYPRLTRETLAVLLVLGCSACGTAKPESGVKVIGGVENYSVAPGVMGLILADASFNEELCTGTVVRDDLILTAAHCLRTKNIEYAFVAEELSGGISARDNKFTNNLVIFPGYQSSLEELGPAIAHDVSFLVFAHGTFSPKQITKLSTTGAKRGDPVQLVGYGDTGYKDDTSNPQLKRFTGINAVAALLGPTSADAIALGSNYIGMTDAGAGQGDSGGPLLNASGEIVGIAHANGLLSATGKPVQAIGNAAIGGGNVLVSLYVNVFDAGVAAFISEVMSQPNPTAATAQDVQATVK